MAIDKLQDRLEFSQQYVYDAVQEKTWSNNMNGRPTVDAVIAHIPRKQLPPVQIIE
jgi:hypothetical protein